MRKILFAIISVLMCTIGLTSCENDVSNPLQGKWCDVNLRPGSAYNKEIWVFTKNKLSYQIYEGWYEDGVFTYHKTILEEFWPTLDYTYENGELIVYTTYYDEISATTYRVTFENNDHVLLKDIDSGMEYDLYRVKRMKYSL